MSDGGGGGAATQKLVIILTREGSEDRLSQNRLTILYRSNRLFSLDLAVFCGFRAAYPVPDTVPPC